MALCNNLRSRYLSKQGKQLLFLQQDYSVATVANESKAKPFNSIPGPLRLPIWGNLHQYKTGKYKWEKYHQVLECLYHEYGPVVREDHGAKTIVHVFDPDDIKTVYSHEDHTPYVAPLLETSRVYREQKEMSPGLGNSNGEEWYRLRRAVRQMMLRPKEVLHYLPMVQKIAEDFVTRLERVRDTNEEVHNLRDHVAKWQMETSAMVCFEKVFGAMSGGEPEDQAQAIIDANKTIFRLSGQLKFSLPLYQFVTTPKWKRLVDAEDFFYSVAKRLVNDTIKDIESAPQEDIANGKYNFMAYLLSRKELSRKDVNIVALSLFSDGLTTTVPAVLYNLYCLATNPEVQETAYQEISSVLKPGGDVTADVLNQIPYLKAVVKETFRLYPVGTEISRITQKDMVLSGYQIPNGTSINLNPNVHFRSEKYFVNADQFLPERWLRGKEGEMEGNEINHYVLTPFGHGTRTCAGRRFAEQDMHVLLSLILQRFKISSCKEETEPLGQTFHTLLVPDRPVRLHFTNRTN